MRRFGAPRLRFRDCGYGGSHADADRVWQLPPRPTASRQHGSPVMWTVMASLISWSGSQLVVETPEKLIYGSPPHQQGR